MKKFNKFKNHWWIIAGIVFLQLIIISIGAIGFYSIQQSHNDSTTYIDSIDHAREVQVLMSKQFISWNKIVLEGNNPEIYRKEYYSFSKYATLIQDLLFNLKISSMNLDGVQEKISLLKLQHEKITREYVVMLVKLNDSNFSNKNSVIKAASGKDEEILKGIDEVVADIKTASSIKINQVNTYYLNILSAIFVIFLLISIVFSFYLVRKIISGWQLLEKNIHEKSLDLAEAGRKIKLSEEKYKRIVEGSNEIIFTLDETWNILTINNAVKKYFNIKPDNLYFKNFLDYIHEDIDGDSLSREFIKNKLQIFSKEKMPIQFKADFKFPNNIESKTMNVRLEYFDIEGKQEIFGNAAMPDEDSIEKYIVKEKITFQLGNSLVATEEITFRLTNILHKYMEPSKAKLIRIALREILINSIEHGNLDINFNEKSEAMLNDDYMNLINKRQRDKKFCNKKVKIDYSIDSEKLIYRITDEGNGFDHEKTLNMSPDDQNDRNLQHGRGINMSRQIFDVLKYNNKGNQVLLVCNL